MSRLQNPQSSPLETMNSAIVGLGETPQKIAANQNQKAGCAIETTLQSQLRLDSNGTTTKTRMYQECSGTECVNGQPPTETADPMESKRSEYLSWDEYFMAVALLSAQRSKDPNTQVGACIVDERHKIVGIGYNGMPTGCPDDQLPWGKTSANPLETKYPFVCHAEMNAIMNKNSADLHGCSMFVALFPCNECAKLIIQAGIKKVTYLRDKPDKLEMQASRRLLALAGIQMQQFTPAANRRITIELSLDATETDGAAATLNR